MMKSISQRLYIVILLLFPALLFAQQYSFTTYTDTYKQGKKEGETAKATYVVDGNNFATSAYMNDLKVITNVMNLDDRKMTMITYAGQSVQGMQMDMPHPDSVSTGNGQQTKPKDGHELLKTEETKNADGFVCRKYEMDTDDAFMEVWMLEGHEIDLLGVFAKMTQGMPAGPTQMGPTLMSIPLEKGFPMEMYYEPKNKKQPSTLTRVSNLEIGNIDTSVLDVSDIPMIEIPKQ
jgi:hypothetical protein